MGDTKRNLGGVGFGLSVLSLVSVLLVVVGVLSVGYGLWMMVR